MGQSIAGPGNVNLPTVYFSSPNLVSPGDSGGPAVIDGNQIVRVLWAINTNDADH